MLEKIKNISKKIITLIIVFAIMPIYILQFPLTVYAANNVSSLSTPINLRWKEGSTATATWNTIENANYYNVIVNVYSDSELLGTRITGTGTNEIDVQQEINDINYNYKLNKLYVTFMVQAVYEDENTNVLSNYSEESTKYVIEKKGTIKLPTPTNVAIDDDYNLTWDVNTTNISDIEYFNIYYKIKDNNTTNKGYLWLFNPEMSPTTSPEFGMTIVNGKATVNLKNSLAVKYKNLGYNGETVEASFYVIAIANNNSSTYLDSNNSEYSNSAYYTSAGSTKINAITLSPSKPVIAVGRTMYIGKTIDPDNAYYSSINWTTSNSSIVSISNMGQITGMKKGNATITAQINNATQTAEVSVYEIETNITNNAEANNVLNEANNVIEAVTTNGDITNTDIVDKTVVINEIRTAAENGNKFKVDIKYDSKAANNYNNIKNEISTKFKGFNIIGGSDIKIEISHKDNSGTSHHIANITELENNVSVQFDMKSNIPEKPRNMSREYKLVRCHDDNIEEIDFKMNNGIVETSSNKFSDFILVYKDQEVPTYNISGEIMSYKSNTDDISIQLYESGSTECIYEEKVQGNSANYTITNVPVGNYTLKFIKANHTTREYPVTIDNSDITLNAKIYLFCDVNGDGKINLSDAIQVLRKAILGGTLTEEEKASMDINGDGKVNLSDALQVLRMAILG